MASSTRSAAEMFFPMPRGLSLGYAANFFEDERVGCFMAAKEWGDECRVASGSRESSVGGSGRGHLTFLQGVPGDGAGVYGLRRQIPRTREATALWESQGSKSG